VEKQFTFDQQDIAMINVTNLKKQLGSVQALKGISFHIAPGEFYGLLGPNGAGKTTTINILSSILQPDEGSVEINGIDLQREPLKCKALMGVVPQEIALYNQLSAWDNLMFWGGLYDVKGAELKQKAEDTLKLFGLYDRRNDKVSNYSGGMKRRINIATALMHSPKILFMDEPTVGIDPQSRNLIFEVIAQLHKAGMTVIYTTHYMEEAERFCDRIGIIDNGEIIAQGSLDELKRNSPVKEIISVQITEIDEEAVKMVEQSLNGEVKVSKTCIYYYTNNTKTDLPRLVIKCNELGLDIQHIDVQKVNLETIFLGLTGKQLRD
jgi:ABC-2 type transport system ATP-binding protein